MGADRVDAEHPRDLTSRFGRRVRELRERAGLSQGDLADASGISKVFLGVVERAEKSCGLESVEKIANGLNVDPVDLFRFKGPAEAKGRPAARMGKKVASLAVGASMAKLKRFVKVAKLFFMEDE
jgi:transcriptional regulator with XRE-family HTH domain